MKSAANKRAGISDAFAGVLRSGRAEFNRQFAEARRLYPNLNSEAFSDFLRREADRLVQATEQARPDRVAEVAMAAYEAGLELAGQKLVGPGARHDLIEEGWRRVLPPLAAVVASAPTRIIRSLSNAMHHLATTPGARPEHWLAQLEGLGPQCGDAEALLRLGQVAAWRAGLVHFRQGAIAAADGLSASLALAAVGAGNSSEWPEVRERLQSDPWFDPSTPVVTGNGQASRVRVMAQAGGFRGFGGLFVEPPRVAAAGEHFLVRSKDECWLLTADVFGATFHRSSLAEFEAALQHPKLPPGLRVTDSKVVWRDERFEIPSLGKLTSTAANATTLALTSELTHSVVLLALN